MLEIIDLTIPIGNGIGNIPGHPHVKLEPLHTHTTHGRSNTLISMSLHNAGTHVDAPYHFYRDKQTIDFVPLTTLIGTGTLIDLRENVIRKKPIEVDDIQSAVSRRLEGSIPVLYTDWCSTMYHDNRYYTENPYLTSRTADWFVEQRIKALAADHPLDDINSDFPTHKKLLGAGIAQIENVINLDKLVGKDFELYAIPIKIASGDGAPARVFAVVR